MKKISRLNLILFGSCAVIWTIRAVLEAVHQTYQDSVFWFVMNMLCAVLWIAAFIVNMYRYRAQNSQDRKDRAV